MRIAGLLKNDMIDGYGFCVSVWAQGCPHRCPGCHNPETWDFTGGYEIDFTQLLQQVREALDANGVKRNLSFLGGEPLCPENIMQTNSLALCIRGDWLCRNETERKMFIWTGYTIEELIQKGYPYTCPFLWADYIIDGPYIQEQRDITLALRGSPNQRIITIEHQDDASNILRTQGEIIYVDKSFQ